MLLIDEGLADKDIYDFSTDVIRSFYEGYIKEGITLNNSKSYNKYINFGLEENEYICILLK